METNETLLTIEPCSSIKKLKEVLSDDRTRLAVYEFMFDRIVRGYEEGNLLFGFCLYTPRFIKKTKRLQLDSRLKVLPELWKMKPKDHSRFGSYWFDATDVNVRKEILTDIIVGLKSKIEANLGLR